MMNKTDEALAKYKVDRIVVYKFEKGKTTDDIDFLEHKDVIALMRADGGISVYDGKRMISYPYDRLYEIEVSGEPMNYAIQQALVVIKGMEKEIQIAEQFREQQ